MSAESPASVLFSSDGTELSVVSNSLIPAGTRALLISGQNPSGNANYVPTSAQGALGVSEMSNSFVVQSNATVTTTGSTLVVANYFGTQEIAIIVNVGTVTGAGSITYTIQEVDPGNGTTVFGNSSSTVAISSGNAPGVFIAVLNITTSPAVKVSWTVSGIFSASIYTTVVTKSTPSTQTVNGTVTATISSVGADGGGALGFDMQVGGIVSTAAPTYVTGNLNALSLTTKGGLRIDGVYPTATATGSAADMMQTGGIVTTAAPTYSNNTINSLSLDTAGNLRIFGTVNQGSPNTLINAWPVELTDGYGQLFGEANNPINISGFVVTNKASTSSVTSVAVTASTNTTLLAANSGRIAATIFNGSNKLLYVKYGATASLVSFSLQLMPSSFFEVQNNWISRIDAFSPSGASGNVLVTELTA